MVPFYKFVGHSGLSVISLLLFWGYIVAFIIGAIALCSPDMYARYYLCAGAGMFIFSKIYNFLVLHYIQWWGTKHPHEFKLSVLDALKSSWYEDYNEGKITLDEYQDICDLIYVLKDEMIRYQYDENYILPSAKSQMKYGYRQYLDLGEEVEGLGWDEYFKIWYKQYLDGALDPHIKDRCDELRAKRAADNKNKQ